MAKTDQATKLKNAETAAKGIWRVRYVILILSATNPVTIEVHISGLSLLKIDGSKAAIKIICPRVSTVSCQCMFS